MYYIRGYQKSETPVPGSNPKFYMAVGSPLSEVATNDRAIAYNTRAALASQNKEFVYRVEQAG